LGSVRGEVGTSASENGFSASIRRTVNVVFFMLVSPSASIGILLRKTQRCKTGVYYICFNKPKNLGCSAGLGQ
jgi:hypothetical protein